jgi:bla regulator protein blaR1
MFQWMLYVVIVTLILSAAALSAERAVRLRQGATRWVWITAIIASLAVPTIIASGHSAISHPSAAF